MTALFRRLFARKRRICNWRADYDTGQPAEYFGPINWQILIDRMRSKGL